MSTIFDVAVMGGGPGGYVAGTAGCAEWAFRSMY